MTNPQSVKRNHRNLIIAITATVTATAAVASIAYISVALPAQPQPDAAPVSVSVTPSIDRSEQELWLQNLKELRNIIDLPTITCFSVEVTNWKDVDGETVNTPLRDAGSTPTFSYAPTVRASVSVETESSGHSQECVVNLNAPFTAQGFPDFETVPAQMEELGYSPVDAAQPNEAWNYAKYEVFREDATLADYLYQVLYIKDEGVETGNGTTFLDRSAEQQLLFSGVVDSEETQAALDAVASEKYEVLNRYAEALLTAYRNQS
jgi:hypothetical protein